MSIPILIAGYYGFHNTGDEAILAAMLDGLRAVQPDLDPVVVSGDPPGTQAAHGVRSILWTDMDALVREAEASRLILLGGGGLFHDYWDFDPNSLLSPDHSGIAFYTTFPMLAMLVDKPLMLYAVGIGPLRTAEGQAFTRAAFELADVATVRDEESRRLVISLGIPPDRVQVTADPAFALRPAPPERVQQLLQETGLPANGRPLLGVGLRNWDVGVRPEEWESQIAQALDRFLERHGGFAVFVPLQDLKRGLLDDAAVAERVRDRMQRSGQSVILPAQRTAREKAGVLAACDLVLGMRLHALIFALRAGVPSVGLVYDPKVRLAMEQAGCESYTLDLASASAQLLTDQLERAYRDREEIHSLLADRAGRLDDRAQENARLAALLLHQPMPGSEPISGTAAGLLKRAALHQLRTMQALRNRQRELVDQVGVRQQKIEALAEELGAIHRSRHWRLMTRYWESRKAVRQFARQPSYANLRALWRAAAPGRVRKAAAGWWPTGASRRRLSGTRAGVTTAEMYPPATDRYDLICFPIIDWEFRFQRPQQLMSQFARHGHRGFYLRTTFHSGGSLARLEPIGDRLYGLQLPGPADLVIYRDELSPPVLESWLRALAEIRQQAGVEEALCLVQLPFWTPLALEARERWGWKVVYDCMDEHSGFSTNSPAMLAQEDRLIRQSDLVTTTARALYDKVTPLARRSLWLPNAGDFDHFCKNAGPNPLEGLPHPVIGYYGAISDWFDAQTVSEAARARPNWQFVLIGRTFGADLSALGQLPNVHLLGEQPYADLPAYLHRFDVACIPFLLTPLTRATNPVKFFEYLSAGKPVVATDLPELEPYHEVFYPLRSAAEFIPQVEAALREDSPELLQRRLELARQHTWEQRYHRLSEAILDLYGRVAIIVVSYNNLEYLKQCMDSLWTHTAYPNFEVIVVDNGSGREVTDYLTERAGQEPRLKLVLNGANLGFARANNLGIQAAGECDYLVLLNDDTVVTRGWLSRMVHSLQDPAIGLIGPVTNWAGNEARIEVDYQGPEQLEAFAARNARRHAGQSFDIPMLAMYCLGMRRSLLDEIGPLDERFGIGMFEDDDFALRVRQAGKRVVCAEDVFVHHWGRASFNRMDTGEYDRLFEENRRQFEKKWGRPWVPHHGRR